MTNMKVWVFRALVLVAAGLFLVSWFMPWWAVDVFEVGKNLVIIHPWGLEQHLGDQAGRINGADMPSFFAPAMWAYLGLAMAVLLFGLFARDKKIALGKFSLSLPQCLIGGVGVSYIVFVVVAVVYATIRAADFWNLKLIGYTYIDLGLTEHSGAEAGLLLGYWLACAVGPLLVVLAFFRAKITGQSKLST